MNQEEIIAMAKEAGIDEMGGVRDNGESSIYFECWPEQLAAFAAMVAAKEREACALVCENMFQTQRPYQVYAEAAQECAAAIRARGSKEGV